MSYLGTDLRNGDIRVRYLIDGDVLEHTTLAADIKTDPNDPNSYTVESPDDLQREALATLKAEAKQLRAAKAKQEDQARTSKEVDARAEEEVERELAKMITYFHTTPEGELEVRVQASTLPAPTDNDGQWPSQLRGMV